MDGCRDENALRMCPRSKTYRSRIITTEPSTRASATTCGRCRLAARYGCTTEKGLLRAHGATQCQRWRHGPRGLGRDQSGTCICSVASSVAERRVGYRQHAVGCADGWAGEERAKRVLRLSCHSQGHLRKAHRKSYLIRAQAFRRQAKDISTTTHY